MLFRSSSELFLFLFLESFTSLRRVKIDTTIANIREVACRYGILATIKLVKCKPHAPTVKNSDVAVFMFSFAYLFDV